jgi:hypothetical protein
MPAEQSCDVVLGLHINRYIREGRVLHCVLQGGILLNPGLLILFLSSRAYLPSLSTAKFRVKL